MIDPVLSTSQVLARGDGRVADTATNFPELLEILPIAVYTCNAQGYITFYNKAAADLWGREPEIGKDQWCGSWKIYQTDGITLLPLDECPMARTLKEARAIQDEEIIVERPDGIRRIIQPHPIPQFDKTGKLAGAVNMLVDITERKATEQNIASLAAIVQSSDDAIISKTLDGVITSWNNAAERIFGYTADEMNGQPVTRLIPADRMDEESKILERLKQGERIEHFETQRISKDKRILDISLTVSPIKDTRGNITGVSKIACDITNQKLAERLGHENEERFRMAVESTRLGTWEFDPSSGKLEWSEECRKIYGVPAGMQVDYNFFSEHIYQADAVYVQEEIQKAMDPDGDGHYDIVYRILRYSDREPRWIRAQGKVYFDVHRQPERFIGTVLDITEEKTREEQLQNSIELFTTMVDNVPAMIWMSGNDKYADFFNKTWLQFTGRTTEQESNGGWLENVHAEDVQKCIDDYNRSFNEQKGCYTEYRLRRYDGQYRWISDNSVPRHAAAGIFSGFISACMDIDDEKRYREKILENELLLKTISRAAPVGLWMTDTQAQNTFVNETWIEWTGIPLEKQLRVGWLDSVIDEDKVDAPSKFWECLQKREKYSTEFRIKRKGGELRWCLTEGTPYYDINGEFAGYAGSVTDITDIKKLEERKDDFIIMASHELKTPVTSIKGYVELLLNIYDELNEEKLRVAQPTVKSSLTTISKQVTKLSRLISELLDLSRIESGKLELHKTAFDLMDMIEETVHDVRHTTSKHAIIIHGDFEGNIYADKDRISQVLLNLLTNAIKYSPDSGSIDVYVERSGDSVIIEVQDHGIGIDKRDHHTIFDRFYRVEGKSEQTYPGFGIGLFIVNEIVNRHQGSVFVESEKDKGSVFTVILPVSTREIRP